MRPYGATTKGASSPWTPNQGTEFPGPSFTGASTYHSTGRIRPASSMGLRQVAPAEATNAACQLGEPRPRNPAFGNDDSKTGEARNAAFRVGRSLRHSIGPDGLRNCLGTPLGRSFVRGALPLSHSPRQRPEAFGNPFPGRSWRAKRHLGYYFVIEIIRNGRPDDEAAAPHVTSRVQGIVSPAGGVRGGGALSIHRDTGVPRSREANTPQHIRSLANV
jgi:hypothetical protein